MPCTPAGCKRKFASLWRLKVHYRAPPNERGSGKERGHGVELPICPACGEELEPGKHHNKCKAGRTTNPPSKRVPKAGAAAARGTKPARAGAGTAKKKAKRAERPAPAAAVESTSGNSYADAAGFMPPVMAHDGVAVGMPHGMFAAVRPTPLGCARSLQNSYCSLLDTLEGVWSGRACAFRNLWGMETMFKLCYAACPSNDVGAANIAC